MAIHLVQKLPAHATPLFVIGGDHHLHQHQYRNQLNDRGIPNRVAQGMKVLEAGYEAAVQRGIPFVINGDLTHNKNSMDPLVTTLLHQFFTRAANGNTHVILVPGNHEKPEKFRNVNTLQVFAGGAVTLVNNPTSVEFGKYMIHYVPFAYDHKAQVAKLGVSTFAPQIFVGHFPTSGVNLGKHTLQSEVKFEDFQPERFLALLFNDIHKHQPVGPNGYHLGATMQNNFGEEGYDCGWWAAAADDSELYLERIPVAAPQFFYTDSEENADRLREQGHYARIRPQTLVKKMMAVQESARIDFNLNDLNSTLDNYVKYQVEAGRFSAEDAPLIVSAAKEVLK